MKYYSPFEHERKSHFAKIKWQKKLKRQGRIKKAISNNSSPKASINIKPPLTLNFDKNYLETVSFFGKLREALLKASDGVRPRVSVDLASIQSISLGAALVLAAEIDRWREHRYTRLTPQLTGWNTQVLQVLQELRFFNLFGVKGPERVPNDLRSDITVLPLVGCNTADGKMVKMISDHLKKVAEILMQSPVVYGAMFEAAYNSTLHAYPKDHNFKYPPIRNRWWATASWSSERGELSFMVFDQGVGIADTLPRWHLYEHVISLFAKLGTVPATVVKEHATMISAALEVSRTSRAGGHGQGLCDIVGPIDTLQAGRLRILSGKGEVLYYPQGKKVLTERELHIGGTLVEWILPVVIR